MADDILRFAESNVSTPHVWIPGNPPPTGVEDGETCFCSSDSTAYQRLGRQTMEDCGMKCAGDSTATCGGKASIEVFEIENAPQDHHQEQGEQLQEAMGMPTSAGDSSTKCVRFVGKYFHRGTGPGRTSGFVWLKHVFPTLS